MNYLLDTNICIHFFRGRFNLLDRFTEVGIENCAISEITLAELVFGAENSTNTDKNHEIIERFSDQVTILPILDSIYKLRKRKSQTAKIGNND